MHPLLLPTLAILAGTYILFRNIRLLTSETALRDYVMTSPKALHWLKTYGEEKTIALTRRYFLPLGVISALALLSIGSRAIWQLAPEYLF